jgi:hypothetical protein
MPREVAIPYAAAGIVAALGLATMLAWRWWDHRTQRRRVAQSVRLAAAVREERGFGLFVDDPTEDVPLVVDPPVARPFVAPLDTAASMDPARPTGWVDDAVWATAAALQAATEVPAAESYPDPQVPVGNGVVHRSCANARRDGQPARICAVCAPHLVGTVPR